MSDIYRLKKEHVPAEAKDIMQLCRQMHAESPYYRHIEFDSRRAIELADEILANPYGRIFVARDDTALIGLVAGIYTQHFFSYRRYFSDLLVYVVPERRGGSLFFELVDWVERDARKEGCHEVCFGVSTGNNERVARAYEHLGYTRSSIGLAKELH